MQLANVFNASLRDAWYKNLEEYSGKNVTFWKDRLPAISAVAKRILDLQPDDEDITGLSKSTLIHDLF